MRARRARFTALPRFARLGLFALLGASKAGRAGRAAGQAGQAFPSSPERTHIGNLICLVAYSTVHYRTRIQYPEGPFGTILFVLEGRCGI